MIHHSNPSPSSSPSVRSLLAALLAVAFLAVGFLAPAAAAQWQPVDDRPVQGLQVLPGEPPSLLAVSDGELVRLPRPGGEWQVVEVPPPETTRSEGAFLVPTDVALTIAWVSPRDPDHLLVARTYRIRVENADGEWFTSFEAADLLESHDAGTTWQSLGGPLVFALATAPSRPDLVYAGYVPVGRQAHGLTLERLAPGDHERTIVGGSGAFGAFPRGDEAIAVDAADPLKLYVADRLQGLRVTGDGGDTWETAPVPASSRVVVAHPVLPGVALAGAETGAVWRTGDGGETWEELPGALPEPVDELDYGPVGDQRAYAVAGGVAYASDDGGATWTALTEGLPDGASVDGLEVDPGDPSRLFADLADGGVWYLDRRFPATPCVRDDTTLCLGADDRYAVRVAWEDFHHGAGLGRAVRLDADDSGAFWFFAEDNLELVVKALDGRPVNGFRWVFYGAMTNVPFTLVVTDTSNGETVGYRNPEGRFASRGDTLAFPEGSGFDELPEAGEVTEPQRSTVAPGSCLPGPRTLCLDGGRFEVSVDWQDFQGGSGEGTAVPATDDSGLFWFFRDGNLELAVKVLDGSAVNGRWWVFYASLTNVPFELTVTDTETGRRLTYGNPAGNFASRGDTEALVFE